MKVVVLTGPTGVGKTDVAVHLAERYELELISADSRQLYCWLDIGTDKPSLELRSRVRFHMVDTVEHDRAYSAADYARDALAVMRRLREEGKRMLVVGGAGMYIRALFEPLFEAPRADSAQRGKLEAMSQVQLRAMLESEDPARASQLHPNDRQRTVRALEVCHSTGRPMSRQLDAATFARSEFEPVYVILTMERERLRQRIDERFDRMMQAGLLDEVRVLRRHGFSRESSVANAYGYAELLDYLDGKCSLYEAVETAKAKTRMYAKRQLTWCRKLDGAHWYEYTDAESIADQLSPLVAEAVGGKQ